MERMALMPKKDKKISLSLLDELHTSGAGYDILRYISLPDMLGEEADTLLYFVGRNLARTLEMQDLGDVFNTYDKLGWGRLELVKEKKHTLTFHLMDDAIVRRLNAPFDTEFRLEAGFLAEAIQTIKDTKCECTEKIYQRIHQVQFTVFYTE